MEIAFSIVFEKLKITGILVNFGDFDRRQISLFSTPKHINRHSTVLSTQLYQKLREKRKLREILKLVSLNFTAALHITISSHEIAITKVIVKLASDCRFDVGDVRLG